MPISPNNDIHDLNFYKFAINSLPVAVVTIDPALRITGLNSSAEEITGYSKKEAVGRYCSEILKVEICETNCPLKKVLSRRESVLRIESTIQNRFGEIIPIRQHTAGLLDDRGNLIGGLEAFVNIAQSKAQEREKANLISMFAHDMKSPLISIKGFALRLLKNITGIDEEKRKKYLKMIAKESEKLERLINDFLEYSHLQTGKLNFNFSVTSLDKELIEVYDTHQAKFSRKGIQLELRNVETLPPIIADANHLYRVFSNLLDNALKFSQEKSTITIATHQTDQDILVRIIDQGTGIDPMDFPYIFDPFHRGHVGKKRKGYGLGLAGVKAIVEGHGGRVLVESELGKGSVFTVILPKSRK